LAQRGEPAAASVAELSQDEAAPPGEPAVGLQADEHRRDVARWVRSELNRALQSYAVPDDFAAARGAEHPASLEALRADLIGPELAVSAPARSCASAADSDYAVKEAVPV
jgi:hypothetical protein